MKQWHQSQGQENPKLQAVFVSQQKSSNKLRDYCAAVVLHFSAVGELCIASETGVDDSLWRVELDSFHQTLMMVSWEGFREH
jgi:hypothetical protein